ncbi:hypothetical protein [Streptomyces xanthochromogenes]|uniref:hypothetical protein n=1 Tax=Streptomyces xanthochromogenes TaxID=67384 RepID=UPI003818A644
MKLRNAMIIAATLGAALLSGPDAMASTAHPVSDPVPPAPYSSKYDNIDLDKILQPAHIINQYYKCLLHEGACQ